MHKEKEERKNVISKCNWCKFASSRKTCRKKWKKEEDFSSSVFGFGEQDTEVSSAEADIDAEKEEFKLEDLFGDIFGVTGVDLIKDIIKGTIEGIKNNINENNAAA